MMFISPDTKANKKNRIIGLTALLGDRNFFKTTWLFLQMWKKAYFTIRKG